MVQLGTVNEKEKIMAENTGFDFGAVSVVEAEMPKTAAGRNRKHAHNPFTEPLAASYEAFLNDQNSGRQVVVPGAAVSEAVYLIRQAATDLKIGARVLLRNAKGEGVTAEWAKKSPRANVTVLFSGKNRKQSKSAAEGAPESTEDSTTDEG